MQQCKKKKIIFFPTYLPNQKIQGRGTANKQFFKDGLGEMVIPCVVRINQQMHNTETTVKQNTDALSHHCIYINTLQHFSH